MKGVGANSGDLLHLSGKLFVPLMKRNLVSISALEDKGYKVAFSDGEVLGWHKNSSMNSACVIGVREEGLYRLTIRPIQALVHDSISLSELWNRRLAHLHIELFHP